MIFCFSFRIGLLDVELFINVEKSADEGMTQDNLNTYM